MNPDEPIVPGQQRRQWTTLTRVTFRFCFVYFGLFCLTNQIFSSMFAFPDAEVPDLSTHWPVRQIVVWTASHVFHVKQPMVYTGSGSGDKTFDWVLTFCLLVFAAVATLVWSAVDRKRQEYATLYKWFRVAMRFALASQMIVYGMDKAIPLQMPSPYLTRLLEPSGNMSPMGVLWFSIGASPAYEIFAGCAELLGGVLLILPRTTMFGALVCLADMIQVFMLNMTYDVPVKLFSFHLIVMALFLLAPGLRGMAGFFFNRETRALVEPQVFRTRRANRIALALQVTFGLWLVGLNIYGARVGWRTYGQGSPKSALYGIWNVEQLTIDGANRQPLLNDNQRWRRVIFDFPTAVTFQRMDDSFAWYGASVNPKDRTVALTKGSDPKWKASLSFERPANDRLTLNGKMDGHEVSLQLRLFDHKKYQLWSRGFHWVQEYPFNR